MKSFLHPSQKDCNGKPPSTGSGQAFERPKAAIDTKIRVINIKYHLTTIPCRGNGNFKPCPLRAIAMLNIQKKTRIVVIGVGAVGSTTAYTLLLRNRMDELVLIDANKGKAIG
ncbi:MAG: ldh2, partial [Daejeonella sp.]|nr:ldh2 [Daejeonella sp.]